MRALIVLAQPKRTGFNRAIADAAADALKGSIGAVEVVDLYADRFDPVMPAEEIVRKFSFDETTIRYQEAMKNADRVVFIHPDWWGGPPAALKGFLDRVLRPGVAYGFREADFAEAESPGLFTEKRFDVFISTDASKPGADADWPPAAVWKRNVLEFCGARDARVHVFWNLRGSSFAERNRWIEGIVKKLA